ncbi:MAG: hypothetical protein WCH39_10290 [Schlesneria sp.]
MRHSPSAGALVKMISTEITTEQHKRLRDYSKEKQISVQNLIRQWILPQIESLPPPTKVD